MKRLWYVLFASPYALAAPPVSMNEVKTTPKRALVFFCYASDGATNASCEGLRKYVKDPKKCDPIELIEPQEKGRPLVNPTAEQVETFLKGQSLPANVPVIVSSHAVIDRTYSPKGELEKITHLLATYKQPVDTTAVRDVIFKNMDNPSLWLDACRAGMVCSPNFCMGGPCSASQTVGMDPRLKYLDQPTLDVLEILCKKATFDEADRSNAEGTGDGKVTGPELTKYYCDKKQYHPYEDFYIKTKKLNEDRTKWLDVSKEDQDKQIAEAKRELKASIQQDLAEDLPAIKKELRLHQTSSKKDYAAAEAAKPKLEALKPKMEVYSKELEAAHTAYRSEKNAEKKEQKRLAYNKIIEDNEEWVDEYNGYVRDINYAKDLQKEQESLEDRIHRLGYLKKIYGDDLDALLAKVRWEKVPGGYRGYNGRTGEPTDYQLRAILPNPDREQACVWTGRSEFVNPQLKDFTLYYEPGPSSKPPGTTEGTPGGTAQSHAPRAEEPSTPQKK